MRLLSKDEISKKKNQNFALESAEGLKLIHRVDALRELKSKTEQDVDSYLKASLGAVQEQINEAIVKRDELNKSIFMLQKKLDALLPEMETTRNGLAQKEKSLNNFESSLSNREESVRLGEIDIAEARQDAQLALRRAKNAELVQERALEKAAEQERDANQTLLRARGIESAIVKEKERIESILSSRESHIAQKEKEFSVTIALFEKDKRSFEAEKVKFADRKAMLDRDLIRLQKLRHD